MIGGMTIHGSDPFATPEHLRSPARRLRGRLPAAVTLWTARHPSTGVPAGLTVSSTMVVDGEPGRVLGVIDDESDLWAAIEAGRAFTVAPLTTADRLLADRFAGLLPAPGGQFRDGPWLSTAAGPVPRHLTTWAVCRLDDARPVGWGLLVESTIVEIQFAEPGAEPSAAPLIHYRGRYFTAI